MDRMISVILFLAFSFFFFSIRYAIHSSIIPFYVTALTTRTYSSMRCKISSSLIQDLYSNAYRGKCWHKTTPQSVCICTNVHTAWYYTDEKNWLLKKSSLKKSYLQMNNIMFKHSGSPLVEFHASLMRSCQPLICKEFWCRWEEIKLNLWTLVY